MYRESQIAHAKEHFKDHLASFRQYDGISMLDWRNKNGSNNYHVRYVFDENQKYLYISGDLGSAVVWLTEKALLSTLARYINMVDYFVGKIECSSDKYIYDFELAKQELKDRLLDPDYTDENPEDMEELIEDLYDCLTSDGWHLSDDCEDRLSDIDPDYWEWLYDTGKRLDQRVICWLVGLNMAYAQVQKEKA